MDGITLAACLHELNQQATGARLEKVQQPERDTLLLSFRGNKKLLLSNHPGAARLQLTWQSMENPAQPPMFCMLLRKLLQGGIFLGATQPGFDRIARLMFSARDELGDQTTYMLVVEIMGKHSNIMLVKEDGTLVDSILRVTPFMSSVRSVLPGLPYEEPPAQGKRNPMEDSKHDILAQLNRWEGTLAKGICQIWSGISPQYGGMMARLALPEATPWQQADPGLREQTAQRLADIFSTFKEGRFAPTLVQDEQRQAIACFPFDPPEYEEACKLHFDSMGKALDALYQSKETSVRFQQIHTQLQRVLQNNLERCRKKMAIQRDILSRQDEMEQHRLFGELLMANVYRLAKGETSVQLENYYDPEGASVEIALDARLNPQENAQKYFKKYNKQKAAAGLADAQMAEIAKELHYLEGQQDNLEKCTQLNELREIRDELMQQGYIRMEKNASKRKNPPKQKESQPLHFQSSTGRDILVGKNNAQNDRLTMRTAKPDEMWLHVKNTPGSHVLILGEQEPDDATLLEAAQLAAYYSKARGNSQVMVDYTPRRYIKKPNGSAPGYVIYSQNYSLYINSEKTLPPNIKQLETERMDEKKE